MFKKYLPAFFGLLLLPFLIQGQSTTEEIILEYKGKTPARDFFAKILESRNQEGISASDIVPLLPNPGNNLFKLNIETGQKAIKEILSNYPNEIQWENNTPLEKRNTHPDDPRVNSQWYLNNIQAFDAWMVTTGGLTKDGNKVVIAVIDDGFEVNHEDFSNIFFVNGAETPGDNQDNDGNGFVDDVTGYNFQNNNGTITSQRHGTNVVGALGARGNNQIGISGINWDASILPIVIPTTSAGVEQALNYVLSMRKLYDQTQGAKGAHIVAVTYSGGISKRFGTDFPIWCGLYDKLGEVGILSVGATTNNNDDVDAVGDMPSTCASNYLIMVTNSDAQDVKAREAGYGKKNIDMAVPGEDILTTNNSASKYGFESGTSLSAPIMAGAISLLFTVDCESFQQQYLSTPPKAILDLKEIILDSGDNGFYLKANQKTPLIDVTVSGKRLNIFKALDTLRSRYGDCIPNFEPPGPLNIEEVTLENDLAFVKYNTPSSEEISYVLFDGLGRKITEGTFQPVIEGQKIFTLNLEPSLGTGVNTVASQVFILAFYQGKAKTGYKFYYLK